MMSDHKLAVITGAESGIGQACAIAFAQAGHDVAILYHTDAEAAGDTLAAVKQADSTGKIVACDVSDEASVEAAFAAFESALGVAGVLVNSAGINQSGVCVADMELTQWRGMIGTDLTGAFLMSRRFVRSLHATGKGGAIVNIGSIHAFAVRAGAADYCAAKAGVRRLTETMALEEARHGIRVNAVSPGMILTPMNARAQADAAYRESLTNAIPVRRAGNAEEVAAAVVWLASPAASYVTGASLVIDGGLSLMLGQGA